jgi:hypothetical protein
MVRRKPYRKPQVNQVKLMPEEAVLAGCKLTGTGAASRNNDGTCKNASFECQAQGS